MSVVVAFFALGVVAKLLKSDLEIPRGLYKSLSIFLLLAIGLKGGIALSTHADPKLLLQVLLVIGFGALLPFIAYPLLSYFGGFSKIDAASVAAHYGSVSVGTYAVAVAFLDSLQINYEPYFPLFVVLLEVPAIAVGLLLAGRNNVSHAQAAWHKVVASESIILLGGGLLIGFLFGAQTESVMPLFGSLFDGVLALFLLEMGLVAASRLKDLRQNSLFIAAFGIFMPLVGAALGAGLGILLGLSAGGCILLAVLGASASYIAVPAAMRSALPQANHSVSITASLAVTFPFNVLIGIPLYTAVVQAWV